MTLREDISRLLDDDQLDDATAIAREKVKTTPSDKEARNLYIDLLVLAGEYEKADAQCNLAATFSPQDAVGFSLFRHHLRAMAARVEWFRTGAVPDFTHGPSEFDQLAMKASIASREGRDADAKQALLELDEKRTGMSIVLNDGATGDVRDLDDRIPHALEVLTNGGKYLWIDFGRIESLAIEPMTRPRDLAFRNAELTLLDGAVASVLLPSVYYSADSTPGLHLGRETEWSDDGPLVTGRGQRCLLIGDELVPFHEISSLTAPMAAKERQTALG
ncbi:type VI secretion system accessory protein TagJ [Rhizobium sp. Leaf262]|uniref:type VI secretion system accessory protein TagJ n=1 Tax=Rhizobium sp. Leaf262 TaxID=1736312 RepID=UPI0007159404|nr:type VI secretion system accessory protein TagJ [Rhizobium sp. Leaf262]KQO77677.1 nitrogen fixation protein [Rhizobium sp. Leaf262]